MIAAEQHSDKQLYDSLRTAVDDTIALAVAGLQPAFLQEAVRHGLEGGKRVRPLITMLVCEAVGGRAADALQPAAAIELLHASSLVHDDIMDRSGLRRGKTSVQAQFGTPAAILAGDAMIALAFRLLQRTSAGSPGRVLEAFAGAFLHVCEGQGYDLHLSGREHVSPEVHATMVEKKTAKLLEAAAAIGAIAGRAEEDVIRGAALYGHNLGMAFQAHDDLLDLTGDEQSMGKPAGNDRRNGRATYLTLAYPATEQQGEQSRIHATRRLVTGYTDVACVFLDALPETPARELLRSLAAGLARRVH